MIKPFRVAAALLIIGIVSVALSACGSGGGKLTAPQETEATSAPKVEITGPAETTETVTAVTESPETPAETSAGATAQAAADLPVETPVETASASDGPGTVDSVSAGDFTVDVDMVRHPSCSCPLPLLISISISPAPRRIFDGRVGGGHTAWQSSTRVSRNGGRCAVQRRRDVLRSERPVQSRKGIAE